MDFRDRIRAKAKRRVPGPTYNRVRAEARFGDTLFYEVVVPADGPWERFRDQAYPPFARYLKSKRRDPEAPNGVTVAAFLGDQCYLLDGHDFYGVFREMEGSNASAFHFRVLQWLSRMD